MTDAPSPDADPPAVATDLRLASAWLARNDLAHARPTPLLAKRLAVREGARLVAALITCALILATALTAVPVFDGSPPRTLPLLALAALMAALLLAQSLIDRWVRRVDQRAGATLSRRVAHPIQPGWRAVLGRPYAVHAAAVLAGAILLPVSALAVADATVRQLAVVLLIGQLGLAVINAMQLLHLLRRPVVAEDESSLIADVIMRVDDARELASPSVQSTLPMVLLFGTAPGWWSAAAVAYLVLTLLVYVVLRFRTPSSATVARRIMGVR
ncbi:hypothetical protein HD597_003345 [Nonomuraea thailandensis]|uniref:Uncharacterized protein n=1 Tax=Nonomuraea thailandensis TaxID=1188745 RepID=A0A9X2GEK2_9ACTN|nr:hypothetical protein [Nonomuraea thailandensis]MCP2356325.1 hypothetical protein [Nonomuraea thailandensis]